MKYKAVIFDFDGVIVDSEVLFTSALHDYLLSIGVNGEDEILTQFTGIPIYSIVSKLQVLTEGRYSEEELEAGVMHMFETRIRDHYAKPMPGIQEFFDWLRQRGMHTALGTSRAKENTLEYIQTVGLNLSFNVIVTHEDVKHGKPDPETFLLCAERLQEYGVKKDEIVIIEDSENGIQAGRASGMFTIGFKGSRVRQNTSDADMEVSSYQELKEVLHSKI